MLEPLLAIIGILLPLGLVYVYLILHPQEQKGKNGSDEERIGDRMQLESSRAANLNEGKE